MARVEKGIYCMHHIHRTLLLRSRSRESKNDQKLQQCQKHCSYSSISSGTYFLVFSPAWTNTYTLEREFSPKWHNRTIALCSLSPSFQLPLSFSLFVSNLRSFQAGFPECYKLNCFSCWLAIDGGTKAVQPARSQLGVKVAGTAASNGRLTSVQDGERRRKRSRAKHLAGRSRLRSCWRYYGNETLRYVRLCKRSWKSKGRRPRLTAAFWQTNRQTDRRTHKTNKAIKKY